MSRKYRFATIAAALVGALSAPAAASAATLYVSPGGTSGAKDKSCATAAHSTVQSAVDDAKNGSQVYVCGTAPYNESVTIQDKKVDLSGDPGATIQGQTDFALAILGKKAKSLVDTLTIKGPDNCSSSGGEGDAVLVDGGADTHLTNVSVQDVTGSCDFYVGVALFDGNAELKGTSVANYGDFGVLAFGTASKLHVESSMVDGSGTAADPLTRVGIFIGDGASAEVNKSSVDNNETTSPDAAIGTGIEVAGGCGGPLTTHVQIHDNTLTNNDLGVALSNFDVNSPCDSTGTTAPTKPTDNHVHHNVIVKNDGVTNQSTYKDKNGATYHGYQAGISDSGNKDEINSNTISDNASGAFGPSTTPGGPFLVPIDIQSQPTIGPKVHDNTFNGTPTNPPY